MKSLSFKKDLIGVQEELLRFAYKLTANREEANISRIQTSKDGCIPSCVTSLLIIIVRLYAIRLL